MSVENSIQRTQPALLDFLLGPFPKTVETTVLGIPLDLIVPLIGITLAKMANKFEKLVARQLFDCALDFLQLGHAYNLSSLGPGHQAQAPKRGRAQ